MLSKDFIKEQLYEVFNNKKIDGFITRLENISKYRFDEERYFEIFLDHISGQKAIKPVIKGLYFAGREKIFPWLEIFYSGNTVFKGTALVNQVIKIAGTDVEFNLFKLLSDLLPPGGRLMVEYSLQNNPETTKALEAGVPAILTPIGFILFRCGFTWFKDWYFAEGWLEGNTKLQGEKPINEDVKKKHIKSLINDIEAFLKQAEDNRAKIEIDVDNVLTEIRKV